MFCPGSMDVSSSPQYQMQAQVRIFACFLYLNMTVDACVNVAPSSWCPPYCQPSLCLVSPSWPPTLDPPHPLLLLYLLPPFSMLTFCVAAARLVLPHRLAPFGRARRPGPAFPAGLRRPPSRYCPPSSRSSPPSRSGYIVQPIMM